MLVLFTLIALGAAAWILLHRRRAARRRALLHAPFPDEWVGTLKRDVHLYRRLPDDLRDHLHGRINVFLDEKAFHGCRGLAITNDIRLTIAAQACLLILNRETTFFPGFTTILVYPDTFVVPVAAHDGPLETHEIQAREGESWHRGPVVLSWADVVHDAADRHDGCNVVLHEFAHKLDEQNDVMDGLPILDTDSHYRSWAEVLRREYGLLRADVERDDEGVLDEYGATSPAEFFAVATETFFEMPGELEREHPLLYGELRKFYRVDPRDWRG